MFAFSGLMSMIAFPVVIIFFVSIVIKDILNKIKVRNKLESLSENAISFTPNEFFKLRNTTNVDGRTYISKEYSFVGVYILFNEDKDMYYVGQGKNVINRVNSHFTGNGNGDVYADYKYGDVFSIRMINLVTSGYYNLNALEKDMIKKHGAYLKGYNKNNGNKNS